MKTTFEKEVQPFVNLSRRGFLRIVGLTAGLSAAATFLDASAATPTSALTGNQTATPFSEADIPHVVGWGKSGDLETGVFAINLSGAEDIREAFLETALPEYINAPDYDRMPLVQLVRAGGLPVPDFFKSLKTNLPKKDGPVTRVEWENAIFKVSPNALKRWLDMGRLPDLELPAPSGKVFQWTEKPLSQLLQPGVASTTFSDVSPEHRTISWMVKAKNTPWPIEQGKNGLRDWYSERIAGQEHLYANWKIVGTTVYSETGTNFGPEGSTPYIGSNPSVYTPLGRWVSK